jgi:hypothetical protein
LPKDRFFIPGQAMAIEPGSAGIVRSVALDESGVKGVWRANLLQLQVLLCCLFSAVFSEFAFKAEPPHALASG